MALITLQSPLQTKNLQKPNKLCHRVLVLFYVCFCVIYVSVYLISKQMYFIRKVQAVAPRGGSAGPFLFVSDPGETLQTR